jgi:hypothetical protein
MRTVILIGTVAAAAVAALAWRRRSSSQPESPVELGLSDGSVLALDRSDPSTIELQTLAAGVRDSFTGGA